MIKSIYSTRAFQSWPSYDLIYEWEDEIAGTLSVPVIAPGKISYKLHGLLNRMADILRPGRKRRARRLRFVLSATLDRHDVLAADDVPVIVDYFLDQEQTGLYVKRMSHLPLVLVTSREAYEHLLANGASGHTFKHWPLSLPSKYMPDVTAGLHKEYDLVLLGRLSEGFSAYLDKYLASRPDISVLRRRIEDGHFNFYGAAGRLAGNADTRADYMALLRKSRVILYTTPGIDGDRRTNGFSQVTPRFLEALAAGCNVVLRYPDNADTRYYGLSAFGKSIGSYEDFEQTMDKALACKPDMDFVNAYLSAHNTAVRCGQLKEIFNGR